MIILMPFHPLFKMETARKTGLIPENIYKLVIKRHHLVEQGIKRIERSTALKYPLYYVEPRLITANSGIEYDNTGILFARTIPIITDERQLQVVIQLTAPLVAFGLKGTIHAIMAHEFLHYLDLASRLINMNLVSDEISGTLFESKYADSGRLVDERSIFKSDRALLVHIDKRFKEGFADYKLEDKTLRLWVEKRLPLSLSTIDTNLIKIPVETIASLNIDESIREKLASMADAKHRNINNDNNVRY